MVSRVSRVLKNKRKGRNFESKVRKVLKEKGLFIFPKGVSTPGPDIWGYDGNYFYIFEVKSYEPSLDEIEYLLNGIKNYIQDSVLEEEYLEGNVIIGVIYKIGKEIRVFSRYFLEGSEITLDVPLEDFQI